MITTIQRESTPSLYISFINCLKNMLHLSGIDMDFPINMTYSPILCNALFIIFLITYLFQSANITEICQLLFTVYDLFSRQVPCPFVHTSLDRVGEDEAVTLEILVQIAGDTWHYGVVGIAFFPAEDHPHAVVRFHIPEHDQEIIPVAEVYI